MGDFEQSLRDQFGSERNQRIAALEAELAAEREKNCDLALQLRIAVSYVHRFPRTIGTQLWLEASRKALGIDCPASEGVRGG